LAERTEQTTETSQISAPLRKALGWSPGEKWKRGNRNSQKLHKLERERTRQKGCRRVLGDLCSTWGKRGKRKRI